MFELFKVKRRLKKALIEQQIAEAETAEKLFTEVRNQILPDEDESNWYMAGQVGGAISYSDEYDHQEMLKSAFNLYHTNPHARAIVRNLVKFTLGKGPNVVPDEEKETVKKDAKKAWEDFKKDNKFNHREKDIATRTFRDGEFFLRVYKPDNDGNIKVRQIRADSIAKPNDRDLNNTSYGIQTNPDDIEDVKFYYRVDSDGNYRDRFTPEEIIHYKILSDSDMKRGISVLRIAAKRLKQYEGWLDDRIILNKVRSAIALVRYVPGSAAKVKEIAEKEKSDILSSERSKVKAPRQGTIITASEGMEYKMLSPNVQAADVAEDGRAILLSIAAAEGMPEMIFTSNYENANYSSTLIAQNPWVREIQDWQDFFETFYKDLFSRVIQAKIDANKLPDNTKTTCRVEFPPMILADLEKLAKAYAILFKYKVVSKKSWQGKMGLDSDIENANMEGEDEDEMVFGPQGQPGGKSPLNMPMSPINQFGAKIEKAIMDKDWGKASELVDRYEEVIEILGKEA